METFSVKFRTKSLDLNAIVSALFLSALVFQCCQYSDQNSKTRDTLKVDKAEIPVRAKLENEIQTSMFIEKVSLGNMLEAALGKLAFKKAKRSDIKNYGKIIQRDHQVMNDALRVLASAKGLKLPVYLPENDLKQLQQMSEMETAYFEKLYVKMMIEEHNKYIELFKGAWNSPDTLVSNFANKFLPILEIHRDNALRINGRM